MLFALLIVVLGATPMANALNLNTTPVTVYDDLKIEGNTVDGAGGNLEVKSDANIKGTLDVDGDTLYIGTSGKITVDPVSNTVSLGRFGDADAAIYGNQYGLVARDLLVSGNITMQNAGQTIQNIAANTAVTIDDDLVVSGYIIQVGNAKIMQAKYVGAPTYWDWSQADPQWLRILDQDSKYFGLAAKELYASDNIQINGAQITHPSNDSWVRLAAPGSPTNYTHGLAAASLWAEGDAYVKDDLQVNDYIYRDTAWDTATPVKIADGLEIAGNLKIGSEDGYLSWEPTNNWLHVGKDGGYDGSTANSLQGLASKHLWATNDVHVGGKIYNSGEGNVKIDDNLNIYGSISNPTPDITAFYPVEINDTLKVKN